MAQLSVQNRTRIQRGLMRYWSASRSVITLSKADLQAAINATDTWIDDNAAAYNSALPTAAQSGLTAIQKTLLFCVVAMARVSIATLRRLLGEVD